MSAPSPRPKAFLGIDNYLLGELRVALRPFTMYVIENNRLTKAWRFGQPHVARNDALEDLGEAPSFGKPIIFYDIHSKGAEGYTQLAQEVIANAEKRAGSGARSAHSGA